MELKEIEPKNLTDKIDESMSEAEAEYRPTPEAEQLLEPAPINRPIPARDGESIYEDPYSTNIYNDYKGLTASDNNDQSRNRKWSLLCLIIGLIIGGTVTGLSMHFTKTPLCATLPTASPIVVATPSISIEPYGESTS